MQGSIFIPLFQLKVPLQLGVPTICPDPYAPAYPAYTDAMPLTAYESFIERFVHLIICHASPDVTYMTRGFFYTLQVYSNTKVDASKTKNMTVTTWPEFMYSEGKLYNCVRKNINIQNFLNHKLLLATWTVIPPSTKLIRQEVGLQRKNIYIMTIPSRSTIKIK